MMALGNSRGNGGPIFIRGSLFSISGALMDTDDQVEQIVEAIAELTNEQLRQLFDRLEVLERQALARVLLN